MKSEYLIQAENFAKEIGLKMYYIGEPVYKKHFEDDTSERFVFKIKLVRNNKSMTINFGQSIMNGNKKPDIYDVLACLQKYDVGSYNDFIKEFGYERSDVSFKIYKKVVNEFKNVERLFGDVLDELREIN